jgi:poly(3-hydroxybutyrate) depolymerase
MALRRLVLIITPMVALYLSCGWGVSGCDSTSSTGGGSVTGNGGGGAGGSTGSGGTVGGGTTTGTGGSITSSGRFSATNGFSSQSLTVGGQTRAVSLYAPAGRPSSPALVIAFHGTSGGPEDWIDASASSDPQGLEALADANGFVIAAPRARDWGDGASDWDNHSGNDRYWETRFDANPACGSNPSCNADLVLVRQIIAAAHAAFNVDLKRVYLIGFSNGAFFSELAAMVLRDQVAAFAEAAGGLVKCVRTDSCTYQSTSTNCSTILSTPPAPSSCTSCSGDEKPITIPTSGRKVPGILGHNNQDDGVSVFYDCALSARMQALGYDVSENIAAASGHGIPDGFVNAAWTFFSSRTLP